MVAQAGTTCVAVSTGEETSSFQKWMLHFSPMGIPRSCCVCPLEGGLHSHSTGASHPSHTGSRVPGSAEGSVGAPVGLACGQQVLTEPLRTPFYFCSINAAIHSSRTSRSTVPQTQ